MSCYTSIRFLSSWDRTWCQKLCVPYLPLLHYGICSISQRSLCFSQVNNSFVNRNTVLPSEGVIKNTLKRIKFYLFDRSKMKRLGYLLYETVDQVPYLLFFEEMALPDTFNSWFLVTELHVWMLMVKAMDLGGKEGRILRNCIVEAMWADVQAKGKKLGVENYSAAQEQILTLGDQFQATLLSYDEGLLSDDKVLASALWRRFFERKCNDPMSLEIMVRYVRQQIHYLDNLPEDDFLAYKIKWLPLDKT